MATVARTPLDEALAAAGAWAPPRLTEFSRDTRGSGFRWITVKMADAFLKYLNVGNRPPAALDAVMSMGTQMLRGNFPCNGESMIFDYLGQLVNGQTRLEACTWAGSQNPSFKGFETLVAWGMPGDSGLTVDQTRVRKQGHTLAQLSFVDHSGKTRPFTDTFNLAALANFASAVWSGTLLDKRHQMPNLELRPFVDKYWPALYDALSASMSAREHVSMSKASAAALYFLVTNADPVLGPEFWQCLVRGTHTAEDDPVWVFREHLRISATSDRADRIRRRRSDQKAFLCLGITAWGLWSTSTPAPRRKGRGHDEGHPFLPWETTDGVPQVNHRVTREPASSTQQLILARPGMR